MSCVVKSSGSAKQCAIYVTYSTATGEPVLGVPVTIATTNGEGMFMDVDGPLLLKNTSGKVLQYSGNLPGVAVQDVATYVVTRHSDEQVVRGGDTGWLARTDHFRIVHRDALSDLYASVLPKRGTPI
jgi:hypothetical protein